MATIAADIPGEIAPPGSSEEKRRFHALQGRLPDIFRRLFPDPAAPQTIVVVPSMSLDEAELPKLKAACHYEERLLCLLMLLRRPGIRIVYLSSRRIHPAIIDYHIGLLHGVAPGDARGRLTLLDCGDATLLPLTRKLLARPALLERIRACIPDRKAAHMTCFNATQLERTLAVRLGIPLYGCDPDLLWLGSKSGSRAVFRAAGVPIAPGFEGLRDECDIAHALYELKRDCPSLQRAVVKLDEGFSGEGNALFGFEGAPSNAALAGWIRERLPVGLRYVAPAETWQAFSDKFARMGGIVEAFVEGDDARSPSVQCRIDPLGIRRIVSTHDQVLGGSDGQVFLGCTFPAHSAYATALHEAGLRVADVLAGEGVLGRFGIDFISHRRHGVWEHTALEINLRKGGTTHPFLALQLATGGDYDPATGLYHTACDAVRCYHASDNLGGPEYAGWTPAELLDVAAREGITFDDEAERGVLFHLLGALPEHGKLGAVCIAETREAATELFAATMLRLDRAARTRVHRTTLSARPVSGGGRRTGLQA